MDYSLYGHFYYNLESNSKSPIREKKKRNRKRSKDVLKKLNSVTFFYF